MGIFQPCKFLEPMQLKFLSPSFIFSPFLVYQTIKMQQSQSVMVICVRHDSIQKRSILVKAERLKSGPSGCFIGRFVIGRNM